MEKTAVGFLEEKFNRLNGQLIDLDFQQAKEMEKQQIDDAHFEGFSNGFNDLGRIPFKYYYETFKQQKL